MRFGCPTKGSPWTTWNTSCGIFIVDRYPKEGYCRIQSPASGKDLLPPQCIAHPACGVAVCCLNVFKTSFSRDHFEDRKYLRMTKMTCLGHSKCLDLHGLRHHLDRHTGPRATLRKRHDVEIIFWVGRASDRSEPPLQLLHFALRKAM